MNLLAIDYGTKRMGLAWVETDLGVVLPYGQIVVKGQGIPQTLIDIITTDRPDRIVLGLPLSTIDVANITENEKRVRLFGEAVAARTGIPVVYADERFSSQQADNTPGDVSRDEKSAMIILESYLVQQGKN